MSSVHTQEKLAQEHQFACVPLSAWATALMYSELSIVQSKICVSKIQSFLLPKHVNVSFGIKQDITELECKMWHSLVLQIQQESTYLACFIAQLIMMLAHVISYVSRHGMLFQKKHFIYDGLPLLRCLSTVVGLWPPWVTARGSPHTPIFCISILEYKPLHISYEHKTENYASLTKHFVCLHFKTHPTIPFAKICRKSDKQ